MKELVRSIVVNLVHSPDQVDIKEIENEDNITIEIRVAEEDTGRVIGKEGRIIKAIRTVVRASSINIEKRVLVEVISE